MNRLEKRYDCLNKDEQELKITDICFLLKWSKDGSSDGLTPDQENRYLNYLKAVQKTWEIGYHSDYYEFDNTILLLVICVLRMYDEIE